MIPVLAAPAFDPGAARVALTLPHGLTLAEIVAQALPDLPPDARARARLTLVTARGALPVPAQHWARVRPHAGVRVVIRIIPEGDDALRSILSIAVSVAAVALGQVWAAGGSILGFSGATAGAIASLGVNLIGSLLINALIPPPDPDDTRRARFAISGWRNRIDPDGAVPVVLGRLRDAPPFAAPPWTEIVGDDQYVHAAFTFGEGQVAVSDLRIGETAISAFDEVEIETREGIAGDLPLSLYPRQVLEESIGVELTRPLPRNDLGAVTGGPATETPVIRTTAGDAAQASVILAWPAGLIRVDGKGRKRDRSVQIRIEQRLVTAETWGVVTTLTVKARKAEGLYRQHSWDLPSRGRWQIRLTMLTDETEDSAIQQRTTWVALQSIRPEYPLAFARPLALLALRIKATHQLSGSLDNVSAVVSRICPDWEHTTATWVVRETANPASLYRHVLQSPANPKAVPDAGIDLTLLQDWHDFCRLKGLHYSRVLDEAGTSLRDVLTEIAVAGRATPRHDGTRWGVVIDRPASLIVDHVNARNSRGFRVTRSYVEQPHALIVAFRDAGNDDKPAQRVVVRPGYADEITLTEALDLPWVTDAATAWREGYRRFLEAIHRPDQFEVMQDGALRVATRGDTLALSHDVLSRSQWVARVRAVTGAMIALDEEVTLTPGTSWGLRFRSGLSEGDTIGASTVRIVTGTGLSSPILTAEGAGLLPAPGDLVHIGPLATDSRLVVVTGVEMTADQHTLLRAVAAAPEIDAALDAAVVPPWSARVGAELSPSLVAPPAPRWTFVGSGVSGAGAAGLIAYRLAPGSGPVMTDRFRVEHRIGAGAWTEIAVPAANGGGEIAGYSDGQAVQLRARAISASNVLGAYGPTVTITVGAEDAPIPAALPAEQISVTGGLGSGRVAFATGTDSNTASVQVYRSTSTTLDTATDAAGAPVAVAPVQSYAVALGDTTRTNTVSDPGFATPSAWDAAAMWAVSGGLATHTAGVADAIVQTASITGGKWYRLAVTVSGRTAGTLTPRLTGGSDIRAGAAASANGQHLTRIQGATGNNRAGALASSDFDGSIDDLVMFAETAACLAQGTHHVWLQPLNADGAPGPLAGPFTVTVI